ncbi:MAG: PLDc N-terminal domain-containing protein [Oscillospiraceae bacterium]|nr:PLDc N-terminal domain-containing protein [Oscillospiraceae bacterium]
MPVQRLKRLLLGRTFMVTALVLLQIGLTIWLVWLLGSSAAIAWAVLAMLTSCIVIALLNEDNIPPAYRTLWLLVVLLLPVAGTLFCMMWAGRATSCRRARQYQAASRRHAAALPAAPPQVRGRLSGENPAFGRTADYLMRAAASPLWEGTACRYYPWGKDLLPDLLEALESARQSIWLEFFIIESEGEFWGAIHEVLRRKAAAGVDVRVLYDFAGCLLTAPEDYAAELRAEGIKCHPVSPLRLSVHISDYQLLNRRDHRKVAVIDGQVGFSGGINLADEYIGRVVRFGTWKDTAFRMEGRAVQAMGAGFLTMWDWVTGARSQSPAPARPVQADGLVQPYFGSALDTERVCESAYLGLVQAAQRTLYVATPYLGPDQELLCSLQRAARSGVDVRVLVPGIPDKPYVYWVTQSFFPPLLRAGVRIYVYTPGFVHAKMMVADDAAIIGTANLDYRSLYLHFENGCAFYGGSIPGQVKADLEECMRQSREATLADPPPDLPRRLARGLLRIAAPLL